MVLCWRTEIHVQFTNYEVQAGLANEELKAAKLVNLRTDERLKSWSVYTLNVECFFKNIKG